MWGNNNTISSFYMATTEANRPVRQRKNVTHYSDDNPQTFTVKKKKGTPQEEEEEDGDDESKVISREKPKIKKPLLTGKSTTTTAGEVMDDIIITSTGRIIKRTSKIAETSSVVVGSNSSKKRRASMTSHPPHTTTTTNITNNTTTNATSDTTKLQKRIQQPRDIVVTTGTTTPIAETMEYGINPRTGKMDKRFKKKQPIHDHIDDGGNHQHGDEGNINSAALRTDDSSSKSLSTSLQSHNKQPQQQLSSSLLSSSAVAKSVTTSTTNRKRKVTSSSTTTTTTSKINNSAGSSKMHHTSTTKTVIPSLNDENDNNKSIHLKDIAQSPDTFCNETICLSHTAAFQPILPLPIILPSVSSTKNNNNNNVRISTTSALWSERVVPPIGLTSVSKGPTWKIAASAMSTQPLMTTTASTATTQQPHNLLLPPPIITWFALREDDPSYAITGSILGCLSLYDLSAAAPDLCPISVIESTSAAQREQQSEEASRQQQQILQHLESNKPIAKRTYLSYPNAIVQCHWFKQLIIVLTADEIEILQLPSTSSMRYQESNLYGIQTIAHWSLTILNDPSLLSLTNKNNNISIASEYMWKRFNNSNRTTQSPCFSVQHIQNNDKNSKGNNSHSDFYNIFWTTRSSDTFNPTLLQMTVKPVPVVTGEMFYSSHIDHSNNNNNNNKTVTMKSILLPSTKGCTTATTINDVNSSSSTKPETNGNHWRCWTTLCEQYRPPQQQQQQRQKQQQQDHDHHIDTQSDFGRHSFLMIAQTGPETIELLRCQCDSEKSADITNLKSDSTENTTLENDKSVWQDKTIQIMHRQSLPVVTATRGFHHQNSNISSGSNGANDSNHPNGGNSSYQFLPIPDCCLQQFSEFTFVTGTGSRGIRMYRTETLEAVATFGENVQVHGKVAVWSRCAWIKAGTLRNANVHVDISSCNTGSTANNSVTAVSTFGSLAVSSENATAISTIVSAVGKKKLPWWIERDDELAIREREKDNVHQISTLKESHDVDEYWLIGIPHPYRGPSELKTTLYLWKPGAFAAAENETTTTLQLPPGGCFGDYFVSSQCHRMVCVGAESSQMYAWDSVFKSDFAGIMYPVGYKVITDNLEYIEDEEELDEVVQSSVEEKHTYDSDDNTNDAKTLDSLVDSDLAEAMRLSLLELQRQQSNALGEEKISVLCENVVQNDNFSDDFIIPPWPDKLWVNGNKASSPGSPQSRHRALSNSSFMDNNSGFETSFLNIIPHVAGVRDEVKLMIQKRIRRKDAADSGLSILDKPKPKPKRARTANVEVLLQSSVDADLRRRMDDVRTIWTNGTKTTMCIWSGADDNDASDMPSMSSTSGLQINGEAQIPQNDSLKMVTSASQEEQSLAMELLHLSPSNVENSIYHLCENSKKSPVQCLACAGRFVLHSCGIRENPIDYDEIARLEQEEKEREEEERQKERTLKKLQAEAKRKESRRKKKEDIELRKSEEIERAHNHHNITTTIDGAWEEQRSFHEDYSRSPHQIYRQNIYYHGNEQLYETSETSTRVENSNIHDTNYSRYDKNEAETLEYANARPWDRIEPDFDSGYHKNSSIQIDGTDVNPSTSLHPMDALEALAGLAGSMAQPVPIKEADQNFKCVHTSADNDRYDGQSQANGYGNHNFAETRELKYPANREIGISHNFYSDDSVATKDVQGADESNLHVAPIAHVDYRDGRGVLTQLEPSPPPVLTPPLHKPILDPSLDQAMLLAEMAETAVVHGTHQVQRSFHNESTEPVNASTNEQTYRPTLDQSPEAEALLALALSASPKGFERPTVQWSASNEFQQPMATTTDQTLYSYSPSSQRSCFGSTTTSTHAIVVSQFLQQPMAASLTNSTINNSINANNINLASDGDNNTTSASNSAVADTKSLDA